MSQAELWPSQSWRASDPITSRQAGQKKRGAQQQRVLDVFREYENGLTDYEASQLTGLLRGTVAKRRQELMQQGLIDKTDLQRRTDTGFKACVWRAM